MLHWQMGQGDICRKVGVAKGLVPSFIESESAGKPSCLLKELNQTAPVGSTKGLARHATLFLEHVIN